MQHSRIFGGRAQPERTGSKIIHSYSLYLKFLSQTQWAKFSILHALKLTKIKYFTIWKIYFYTLKVTKKGIFLIQLNGTFFPPCKNHKNYSKSSHKLSYTFLSSKCHHSFGLIRLDMWNSYGSRGILTYVPLKIGLKTIKIIAML